MASRPAKPIEAGDLVRPAKGKLHQLRTAFPGIVEESQLRVEGVIPRSVYKRKGFFVVAKPGDAPVAVWATQLRRLPGKAVKDPKWSEAAP